MCVYTTQDPRLPFVKHTFKSYPVEGLPEIANSDTVTALGNSVEMSPVIGIGNDAFIMYRKGDKAIWDWAQFAPMRQMWQGGKEMPYFNAKVETLEEYESGSKASYFARSVLEDMQDRMCVMWVNSFFESNQKKPNPRWFHIYRKDSRLIPLAAFYHMIFDKDGNEKPAFTIVTRDPYELVAQTGHKRSPGILKYEEVAAWLDPEKSVKDKLELLAEIPEGDFQIDEVERYSVTKKTDKASNPIEGGDNFLEGTLAG